MLNKRNLKEERGITLLALIITIIIIVIIAAITINAAYMSGIIQFGVNGARDYAQAAIEENKIMGETEKYVESVTKKIKVLLGEEPPTNPELNGMDWFVKGVTKPAEESKEVADFYAKGKPDGTLIIYPKNGIEATIEYVEIQDEMNLPSGFMNEKFSSNVANITSVYVAKGIRTDNCEYLFTHLPNCTKIDLVNLDTSQATNMMRMFNGCSSLRTIDLTGLDTKQVTDMSYMFADCSSLENVDLTGLDTQQVKDMSFMFDSCSSLKLVNLDRLNTSQVTNMTSMFYECSSLTSIDLTSLDLSQVGTMREHVCRLYGFGTCKYEGVNSKSSV